jgi:tetratricopeptide (TPR) repeat protein
MSWSELGLCSLTLGNLDAAAEYFRNGLDTATAMMNLARPRLLVGSALLALANDDIDAAAQFIEEAREFAEQRAMRHYYPLIAFAAAQVSDRSGNAEKALEGFARAEKLAADLQMRPLVWMAQAGAASVLLATDRATEANEKRIQAKAVIDEIGKMFQDEKLRGMYLAGAVEGLG